MKNSFAILFIFLFVFLNPSLKTAAQTHILFDDILFYDGYAELVPENNLLEPIPENIIRHKNSIYSVKINDEILDAIGNTLTIEAIVKPACDNYDRLAAVYLSFVNKGEKNYKTTEVYRIEIARFITPFMNKNKDPKEVSFIFKTDNVAEILTDKALRTRYDVWAELEIFGVPYAAQTQVEGCEGRIDTFYGSLLLHTTTDPTIVYNEMHFFKALKTHEYLNNYDGTDIYGKSTKVIEFELEETIEDLTLYLITSNHGANSGGEEYNRRMHYVSLDNKLIYEYIPGGRSCEPLRKYNTQGNGIYSRNARTDREWLSFNNWCPSGVVPIREIKLGTVNKGKHMIKLDVPDAQFVENQGYIPVSMYLQNRSSHQITFPAPTQVSITQASTTSIAIAWEKSSTVKKWQILYGASDALNEEKIIEQPLLSNSSITIEDLLPDTSYDFFVRAVYENDQVSVWVGPFTKTTAP